MNNRPREVLCAECLRCGRRSIMGGTTAMLEDGAVPASVSFRCDICGTKRVRLVSASGDFEALSFINRRI